MSMAMQNGQFLRIVLWMLALLLVAAGLVVDHKYGGFGTPDPRQEMTLRKMPAPA